MGNARNFFSLDAQGRRSEYVRISKFISENGLIGSIIKRVGDKDTHTNLPYYSNTSDVYFRMNAKGVCQARVYIGQKSFLDFDWSHNHTNTTDGQRFNRGTVHVQTWQQNKDGSFSRISDSARRMTIAEIAKYGPLLKQACPIVQF